jgi:predicted dinucleotide-binding enzyme
MRWPGWQVPAQLIAQLGFAPLDLGTLARGGRLTQFPGGPLPALNWCSPAAHEPALWQAPR